MSAAFIVGFGFACGFAGGLVFVAICGLAAWLLIEVVVNARRAWR